MFAASIGSEEKLKFREWGFILISFDRLANFYYDIDTLLIRSEMLCLVYIVYFLSSYLKEETDRIFDFLRRMEMLVPIFGLIISFFRVP